MASVKSIYGAAAKKANLAVAAAATQVPYNLLCLPGLSLVIDEVSGAKESSAGANVSPRCRVCLHCESKIGDLAHLNVGEL